MHRVRACDGSDIIVAFNPDRHHRRSIRLRGYDYSRAGAYFITLCTRERACLFGDVNNDAMELNAEGRVVQATWDALPTHYPSLTLDTVVVMPNHVHGVVIVTSAPSVGAIHESPLHDAHVQSPKQRRRMLIPLVVGRLKTTSAKQINIERGTPGQPVWQRNYYEHIIRDADEHNRVRQYIKDNPRNWPHDEENPNYRGPQP